MASLSSIFDFTTNITSNITLSDAFIITSIVISATTIILATNTAITITIALSITFTGIIITTN